MKRYKLLALDMDGTILDSKKNFPKEVASSICALVNQGIHVALATGRGLAELKDYEKEISCLSYGILVSGGIVYDFKQEKPVFRQALTLEQSLEILEAGEKEHAMLHILSSDKSICRSQDIQDMETYHMGIYQGMYERSCDTMDDLKGYVTEHPEEAIKINSYHRSPEARERMMENLAHLPVMPVLAETTSLEISPKGISKAKGLEVLCEHLGISTEEVVAVGDARNDMEILSLAGMPVAMGNAMEEVKEICRDVVSDNDHFGVIDAMQRYF